MSIVYRIDQERGLAVVLWDGRVTADEFLAHARRLLADAEWPPPEGRHLTDLRSAIVDASIDDAVLKEAADLFGTHPKIAGLRVAIVAVDAFVQAAVDAFVETGVFERLIPRHRPLMFVFDSLNPACEWLGVDANDVGRSLQSLKTQSS